MFSSGRGGDADLYVMKADGSEQVAIAGGVPFETQPSWAPDGSEIAFVSGGDVHAIRPDGTGQRLVTTGGSSPDWSPDSSSLAFLTVAPEADYIRVVARDGTGRRTIATDEKCQGSRCTGVNGLRSPAWSPDGAYVAFGQFRLTGIHILGIQVVRTDNGANVRSIGFRLDGNNYEDPAWARFVPPAPSGQLAVGASGATGLRGIAIVDVPTGGKTFLTGSPGFIDTEPAFSTDGSQIAFAREQESNRAESDLWIVRRDGRFLRALVSGPGTETEPAWSPSGTQLVFSSTRAGGRHLFLVDADGQNLRQLTSGASEDRDPEWSGHGTRIAYASTTAGETRVRLIDVAGTGGSDLAVGECPEWSSGSAEVFLGRRDSQQPQTFDILAVALAGGAPRTVVDSSVPNPSVLCSIAAALSGHHIAFSQFSAARSTSDVVVVNADGSEPRTLVPDAGWPDWGRPVDEPVARHSGSDRIVTAVELSKAQFQDDSARTVVLTRADAFPDALAAAPMAFAKGGPILLTQSDWLDDRVAAELDRVLKPGSTVHLVGGLAALSADVDALVRNRGYSTIRYAGPDRWMTAVDIAERGLGGPDAVFLATGLDFADALSGGAAAARAGGVVLLTNGSHPNPATSSYLERHPNGQRLALGGAAAAAYPSATPVVGADRFETSVLVARRFRLPSSAVVASGVSFPDALAAGPLAAAQNGPLLLTRPAELPAPVADYLAAESASIARAVVAGGPTAVATSVEGSIRAVTS